MKGLVNACWLVLLLTSCSGHKTEDVRPENIMPSVSEDGIDISFPIQSVSNNFVTEKIQLETLKADFTAPAKISATVIKSEELSTQNIILFENPDLGSNYSLLSQHLINIRQIQNVIITQRKIELERIKDLKSHGAATGKELLEAQTALSAEESNLENERAALIEHETKLKSGGFEPEELRRAPVGATYVICDIPENLINTIQVGGTCQLKFNAFQDETFTGTIEEVTDMIDQQTRMVKLRVRVNSPNAKLKAGMFAAVSFGINEGKHLSINRNSLVTVQAKNYVFVKTGKNTFARREVFIGNEVNGRIIIFSGVNEGEEVVVKGVMQLKGLSFGY